MIARVLQVALALALGSVVFVAGPACAQVEVRDLPVPKAAIYAGDVIGAEMLVGKSYRVDGRTKLTVFDNPDEVAGKIARRTLLPGQLIPVNAVKSQDAVKQGRPVTLVFEADGLMITAVGVALQSGGPGDYISVQNSDSGSTIKGFVAPDGTVKVGPQQ